MDVILAPEKIGSYQVVRHVAGWYGWAKALIDVGAAALLLLLSSPLLAFTALAIWLDSPGPVLFRQQRIGLHGQPFTIYKFRTMFVEAPAYSYKVPASD